MTATNELEDRVAYLEKQVTAILQELERESNKMTTLESLWWEHAKKQQPRITELEQELAEKETLSRQIVTDWIPANQKLSQRIAELECQRDALKQVVSEREAELSIAEDQYDTDTENMSEFLAVHNRLKEELKECKAELETWEESKKEWQLDANSIRQQTAMEILEIIKNEIYESDIHGILLESRQNYNVACEEIAEAIKTKFGV